MKTRDIKAALLKKGFIESGGDHHYFVLYCDGKKTAIRTKISRSEDDIGDPLVLLMSKQMKLSKKQFETYVECSLSLEQYLTLLRQSNAL